MDREKRSQRRAARQVRPLILQRPRCPPRCEPGLQRTTSRALYGLARPCRHSIGQGISIRLSADIWAKSTDNKASSRLLKPLSRRISLREQSCEAGSPSRDSRAPSYASLIATHASAKFVASVSFESCDYFVEQSRASIQQIVSI